MEDDIAMSLKSEGVRIIAPMPGLGTIGIEVPNSTPQTVSMRSILASRKYREQQEKMSSPSVSARRSRTSPSSLT